MAFIQHLYDFRAWGQFEFDATGSWNNKLSSFDTDVDIKLSLLAAAKKERCLVNCSILAPLFIHHRRFDSTSPAADAQRQLDTPGACSANSDTAVAFGRRLCPQAGNAVLLTVCGGS